MAESPEHDSDTITGALRLAGGLGNLTDCALQVAEDQGIEPSSLSGGPVFKTGGTPLRRDPPYPMFDSNEHCSRSKRDASYRWANRANWCARFDLNEH